jgi:RHS Repeat
MRRAKPAIPAICLLAASLSMGQATLPEKNTATVSEREQRALRGLVKSCTETTTNPAITDAEGKTYQYHSEYTTEYDTDGRILGSRSRNSDGSYSMMRHDYDPTGRLLNTASGVEGQALTETTYSYDQLGRLQSITPGDKPDSPAVFRYDEGGRKSKIEVSRPTDYRPNVAFGGSPFEAADRAPNLPGGGSATTLYDEHDRATEVQVRDASGELVNRALRTYDAKGRVIEEKQVLEDPTAMFPSDARAKWMEESGLSADQLRQEMLAQFKKLMAGRPLYSVSHSYDTRGRVNRTTRRIVDREEEIETTYNEHGDTESEITRSTRSGEEPDPTAPPPGPLAYSEVRYSYQYDQHENWIEQESSYRHSPDGAFQPTTVTKRTLTYY